MPDLTAPPCLLVVADRERVGELVEALAELPQVQILISSGGDDTIDLFESRRPIVVVLTATLAVGDARSLIVTLRGMVRRAEVAIVVVGDDTGPIRTALDALDLAPDRFVTRPLSARALRFAVSGGIESVRLTGSSPRLPPPPLPVAMGTIPGLPAVEDPELEAARQQLRTTLVGMPGDRLPSDSRPTPVPGTSPTPIPGTLPASERHTPVPSREAMRARWAAIADSMADDDDDDESADADERAADAGDDVAARAESDATAATLAAADKASPAAPAPANAEPDVAAADLAPAAANAAPAAANAAPAPANAEPDVAAADPAPAAAPGAAVVDTARDVAGSSGRDDIAASAVRGAAASAPLDDDAVATNADDATSATNADGAATNAAFAAAAELAPAAPDAAVNGAPSLDDRTEPVDVGAAPYATVDATAPVARPVFEPRDPWDEPEASDSAPVPPVVIKPRRRSFEPSEVAPSAAWKPGTTDEIAPTREPTLILREPPPAVARTTTGDDRVVVAARTSSEEIWSDPMPIPELVDRDPRPDATARTASPVARDDLGLPLADVADELGGPLDGVVASSGDDAPDARKSGPITMPPSRDFARELRAKMAMMSQRLFQGSDAPAPDAAAHAPRHDHHTEIDLAALGDEPPLGNAADETRTVQRPERRDLEASPGSWDSQVRERGLPDAGALVRGVSDAAMLLARMFAQGATGRVGFRRDDVETVVYFDQGRPVFATSNEPRDRMGELLAREGKITASQYERCQSVVAESGRRMGEILVDLGYLKRRELLPAVRRHVEDLVYSLFGWERGAYYLAIDPQPSAERIRLSRHPASLILEGIRRKLDRSSLERLIGPTSTVIEVRDRERLGGIVNLNDLAAEERAALAAFDGQADLAQVARTAGVDLADVLPLAWGLCVLGLATARRSDAELGDEGTALIGETDLAIDRERVRARWQLVTDADYFALLGVRRDATGFEIRRAYQSARRDFAADCFPGDLRRELARELDDIAHVLDEAFRVLRDDSLRQTYLAHLIDA